MRLLYPSEKGRDTGDGDDRSTSVLSLLLGHLIGDSSRDKEGPVEVDLLCLEEEVVRHVQEGVERTNACV